MLALAVFALPLQADQGLIDPEQMPEPLREVRFDQKLGAKLPMDAPFVDDNGQNIILGDLFGERPVILAFVYYECPMLCTLVTQGLTKSLKVVKMQPGQDFDVVLVSIDPDEGPVDATRVQAETLKLYGHPETADGWHFLTGPQESIDRITQTAGFSYTPVEDSEDWAHASGIIVVTPEGKLAQYHYGIEYPPKNVRLALVDASGEKLGTLVDQLLLYCFRWNPQLGTYTAVALRVLRVTGAVFAIGMVLFIAIMWRRDRERDSRQGPGPVPEALGATTR